MNELHENGFVVLRGIIPLSQVENARKQINTKVNYGNLRPFINEQMLGNVKKELGMELTDMKYRVSNSNNSADAGSFHRDLHSYVAEEVTPVFTCLTYLDNATMELIPNSHRDIHISFANVLTKLSNREEVQMRPGDVLLFYATMLHRGVFYHSNSKNRRIIQLFDCIERSKMSHYEKEILHIPCRDNCSSTISRTLIFLNKNIFFSELINTIAFFTTARGYGYSYGALSKITENENIKYLSTESNRGRLIPKQNGFEEQNMYIVNTNNIQDIHPEKRDTFILYSFMIDIVIVFVTLILVIFAFIYAYFNRNYLYRRAKRAFPSVIKKIKL